MSGASYFGLNINPGDKMYIHPFVSALSSIFHEVIDWSEEKYEIIKTKYGLRKRNAHYFYYSSLETGTFR